MGKIRVGVVGVGSHGQYHAEKYRRLPGVELAGVADINRARATEVAKRFDTEAFVDYEALFKNVQAVSIAVPTNTHYRVAKDFLSNGIDILVEKPIATTLEDDNTIRFDVSDNGAGMSKNVSDRLFTSFFSTKGHRGTGLGLMVTRKLVEEHGGRIDVASSPGEGTTFTIHLPFEAAGEKKTTPGKK